MIKGSLGITIFRKYTILCHTRKIHDQAIIDNRMVILFSCVIFCPRHFPPPRVTWMVILFSCIIFFPDTFPSSTWSICINEGRRSPSSPPLLSSLPLNPAPWKEALEATSLSCLKKHRSGRKQHTSQMCVGWRHRSFPCLWRDGKQVGWAWKEHPRRGRERGKRLCLHWPRFQFQRIKMRGHSQIKAHIWSLAPPPTPSFLPPYTVIITE